MQTVEDFMRAYLSARSAEIQKEMDSRKPFRQLFFTPDCWWDSHKGEKEQSDSETVEDVSVSDEEARVITRWDCFLPRLRYHLQQFNNSWLIRSVEIQCLECQGRTNNLFCERCEGTGWFDPSKTNTQGARPSEPPPDNRF
jgi:hypothetical protein